MQFLLRFSKKTPEKTYVERRTFSYDTKTPEIIHQDIDIDEGWILDGLQVSEVNERVRLVTVGTEEETENAFTRHKKDWLFFWSKRQIFTFKKPSESVHFVSIDMFQKQTGKKIAEILIFFGTRKQ